MTAEQDIAARRLFEANAAAQRAFHVMYVAGVYGDPDDPRTVAWVRSERAVDAVLAELQAPALAEGDHFQYHVETPI